MPAPDFTTAPDFARLVVAPVDKPTAKAMIVANHYSHKWNTPFGVRNYGVFLDDELLGVAVYGYPMNPKSWHAVTTTDPSKCIELNRLWIDDRLGANTETWLMAQSFKALRAEGFELVQSFADGRLGVGTIYQAANFTFHGYHTSMFTANRETGEVTHNSPFNNTSNARGMLRYNSWFVDGVAEAFDVRTYRYLYPLNKRARRAIKLPAQPYPKERAGTSPREGYLPPAAQIARCIAIADAIDDPRRLAFEHYFLDNYDVDHDAILATQRENRWVVALREKYAASAA